MRRFPHSLKSIYPVLDFGVVTIVQRFIGGFAAGYKRKAYKVEAVKTISKYKLVFLDYIVSEAAHINTFGIKR